MVTVAPITGKSRSDIPLGMDLLNRQVLNKGTAVGLEAQKDGVAPRISEDELRQRVLKMRWTPAHPMFV